MDFITFFFIIAFSVYKCLLFGSFNIYYELGLGEKRSFLLLPFGMILLKDICCVEISVC